MIKELYYLDLRDTILRLKYYPEDFHIVFFSYNEKDYLFFNSLIEEITNLKGVKKEKVTYYKNNNVKLKNFYTKEISGCELIGARANIVIASDKYNLETFNELICPLANISPCQTVFSYNTIENLKEYHKCYEECRRTSDERFNYIG